MPSLIEQSRSLNCMEGRTSLWVTLCSSGSSDVTICFHSTLGAHNSILVSRFRVIDVNCLVSLLLLFYSIQKWRVRASSLPPGMQTAALCCSRTRGVLQSRGASILRALALEEIPVGVKAKRHAERAMEALEVQLRQQLQVLSSSYRFCGVREGGANIWTLDVLSLR